MLKDWNRNETQQRRQFRETAGQGTKVVSTSTYIKSLNIDSLVRADTPHYRARLKRGELLPLNDYDKTSRRATYASSYVTSDPTANPVWTSYYTPDAGLPPGYATLPDLDYSLLESELPSPGDYLQAAAAGVYGQGWDALTFAGELGKTATMFRQIGKSLISLMSVRNWPSLYLQYRYGWRTLYYDLLQLQKAIQQIDDKRKRFQERRFGRFDLTVSIPTSWNYSTSYGAVSSVIKYKLGVGGAVVADIEPPKISFNPVKTGWELVTASFIVDWFINIGQWIDAMSFLVVQERYFGAIMTKFEAEWTTSVAFCTQKPPCVVTNCSVTASGTYKRVTRKPAVVPVGLSTIRRLNFLKVTDMVLIIRQLLGR